MYILPFPLFLSTPPLPSTPLWELEKNFFLEFCVISSHLAIPVTKHKQKKKEVLHIVITLFTFFLHPMWINLRTSEELKKKIIQKLINQPNQTNQTSLKKFKKKNWNNRNWTNQMNWFNYIYMEGVYSCLFFFFLWLLKLQK